MNSVNDLVLPTDTSKDVQPGNSIAKIVVTEILTPTFLENYVAVG